MLMIKTRCGRGSSVGVAVDVALGAGLGDGVDVVVAVITGAAVGEFVADAAGAGLADMGAGERLQPVKKMSAIHIWCMSRVVLDICGFNPTL